MPDLDVSNKKLDGCGYKMTNVFCPTYWKLTKVTAAKWDRGESRVRLWDIVDCPLLPAGEVWCDRRCLDQIEEEDRPK
jgi:hypothetical protein